MPRGFIERIQESPAETKLRWVIFLSSISMVFIVYIWVGYFNSIVAGIAPPEEERAVVAQAEASDSSDTFSFFDQMKRGTAVLADHLSNIPEAILGMFGGAKEYNLKP